MCHGKEYCPSCHHAVMRWLYTKSSIGVLPFIEGLSETTSGLVAVSRDSEEHA